MRYLWLLALLATLASGAQVDELAAAARQRHGEAGERAARFLLEHMPPKDRGVLSNEFLLENIDLAFKARAEFPWAAKVPEDIFLNDVLPYAVFDESRDPWRAEFLEMARPLVKDAKSATEAVQSLNRQIFNIVKVHYNTGRKRPNQSPKESMALGMATCTGLSIILADACRAVGIPARAVGTPMWTNERGNHTWTEIWDGEWFFTGADEYDKKGLNRGWFVGDASKAKADNPRYSIYATSWKRDGLTFPMVWARSSQEVAAVNVTSRYAKPEAPVATRSHLGVRLFESKGGPRVIAAVSVVDGVGKVLGEGKTAGGRADLNDMPRFDLPPGSTGWVRYTVGGRTREAAFGPLAAGDSTLDGIWNDLALVTKVVTAMEKWVAVPPPERKQDARVLRTSLTRQDAARVARILAADRLSRVGPQRADEMEKKSITLEGKTLRWMSRSFGEAPADGRSLWISMHGGGGAPAAVNDKQWTNQIGLYEPKEGIYVAPRAPTDTWNMWHEGHVDPLFVRLIEDHVALKGVNPDKVYLMGYSAGGDGVWQLAPRLADRFAAAAMMAGHPNEASLLGLRNLPFALFMGGEDKAYNRNKIAAERAAKLDELAKADPGGYVHVSHIYEGLGHWMNKKDAEALPWMAAHRRNSWPARIVWLQDDITHRRFYWLQLPPDAPLKAGQKIIAEVKGRSITLDGDVPAGVSLGLSDELLDLDTPLTVTVNGRKVFSGKVKRRAAEILSSLEDRFDAPAAATAILRL